VPDSRWNVSVKCSDYDSLTSISRIAGSPDLEYMLRLNQLIINFVKDTHREEYVYVCLFVCLSVCVFISNMLYCEICTPQKTLRNRNKNVPVY